MKNRYVKWLATVCLLFVPLLTACTGGGFHLRDNVRLPAVFQPMVLQGVPANSAFAVALRKAFESGGNELLLTTHNVNDYAQLFITDYQENKRVVGYGQNREVREFLIFTKFQYEVRAKNGEILLPKQRLQVDKTQIYDSEFVLGKTEEERVIRDDLRNDLARKVLIRLRYGYPATENTR